MDFDEIQKAIIRANKINETTEKNQYVFGKGEKSATYIGVYNPPKPTVYNYVVVATADYKFTVCRTNTASSMFYYDEICVCSTNFDATDIAKLLNQREGQK